MVLAAFTFTPDVDAVVADRDWDGVFETVDAAGPSITDRWFHTVGIVEERGNTDNAEPLSVSLAPSQISENGGEAVGTVTRINGDLASPLTVSLFSSDPSEAVVPTFVVILANRTSAAFTVAAVDDQLRDGPQTVAISASVDGYVGGSRTLTVTDYETLTVTVDPGSLSEYGGTVTGTVTRNNTDIGAAMVVSLTRSDATEASVLTSVVIPANQASATFTITSLDDALLDGSQAVTITAAAAGYVSGSAGVSVTDYETLTVTFSPTSLSENNGTATGTVTRSNTDRTTALTVNLASGDTTEASVPATVTIAANQASATFTVTGVNDNLLDGTQTATITASASGYVSGTGTINITDHEPLSLNVTPTSISEFSGTATGTVTRGNTDCNDALTVNLMSNDTTEATVPATVIIPADQASATFTVTAVDDTLLDGTRSLSIGVSATGYASASRTLSVTDYETLAISFSPASISENGGTATGTVTRSNTDISVDLMVSMAGGDTTEANIPATVTIPAGRSSVTFPVTAVDDAVLDGAVVVTITASATGYAAGSGTISVEDSERLTVSISPSVVAETGTATGTVTRFNIDSGVELTVVLASSDVGQATVPATVTILANHPSVSFTITGVDDSLADGTQSVNITASTAGYPDVSQSVAVTDLCILRLSALPASISENGGQATATLVRSNVDLGGELTVLLTSSDPGEAMVPLSVTIPAGQAFVPVAITGVDDAVVDGTQTVTISLNADGCVGEPAPLSVTDDDLPTLTMQIAADSVMENAGSAATTATLTRNTDTTRPLAVSLSSSDTTAARVPMSVTIPAGQTSLQFPIAAVDDAVLDGTQRVVVSASVADQLILDTGFGASGSVVQTGVTIYDVARDGIGRILATGSKSGEIWIARYLPDGTLDTTFSGDGIFTSDLGTRGPIGYSLRFDSSGRIVVGGRADPAGYNYDFMVARLCDDGTLDTSFGGGDGVAVNHFGGSGASQWINEIEVLSSGKILAAGTTNVSGSGDDFALARYTSTGSLDTTFGTSGLATAAVTSSSDWTQGMVVLSDGRAILGGGANVGSTAGYGNFAMAKFTATGTMDTSFGTGGMVVTDLPTGYDAGNGIARQADGKLLLAGSTAAPGTAYPNPDYEFALLRYASTGALDSTFASGGSARTAFGLATSDIGSDVAVQADGRIIVAGTSAGRAGYMRYNSDGTVQVADFGSSVGTSVNDLLITMDGKVFLAGSKGTSDSYLERYEARTFSFLPASDSLDVLDSELPTLTMTIAASSVAENAGPAATTVTISRNSDTAVDLSLTLASSDPSEAAVPATATIPAGQAAVTVSLTAVDDNLLDGTQTVTISASSAGFVTGSQTLSVTDYETLSVSIAPTSMSERGGQVPARVTRSNTDVDAVLTVLASSSDTTEAGVPAMVTIPAGQASATYVVWAVDDALLDGTQTVTIGAASSGYGSGSAGVTVTDEETLTVTLSPGAISENGGTATGTVTRSNTDRSSPLTVALTSSDGTVASVPATVVIAANAYSVTFTVTGVDDTLLDGIQTATVTASAGGYTSGAASVVVTDDESLPLPDVNVQGNGQSILNGDLAPSLADHTDFGNADVVGATVTRTFTIQNLAAGDLVLTGTPLVQILGPAAGDFAVIAQPSTPIALGASVTVDVQFDPSAPGLRWATVVIASNDPYDASYEFAIQGTGEADFGDADYGRWAASYRIESVFDSATVPGQTVGNSYALNNRGEIAVTTSNGSAMTVWTGSAGKMRILLQDPNSPGFSVWGFNDAGQVALFATPLTGDIQRILLAGGTTTTTIQQGTTSGSRWGYPSLNQAGEVAYEAGTYMVGNETIKYYTGGMLTTPVDLTGLITSLSFQQSVSLNNRGQITFAGSGRPAVGQPSTAGGFVYDGATRTITRFVDGSAVSGIINDVGEIAYLSSYAPSISGLWKKSGEDLKLIAKSETGATLGSAYMLNNHGDVVFSRVLTGGYDGLFLGPDLVADKLIAEGDSLFGSTLTAREYYRAYNDRGQIAFKYTLANGVSGVALASPVAYPTELANGGAWHAATGPRLGAQRDIEPDGQPTAAGDDGSGGTDDEDGVVFPTDTLRASTLSATTASVQVDLEDAGAANILNAWIDWNRDGDWNDPGEQIFTDTDLGSGDGVRTLSFTIPQVAGNNVTAGDTFARFRLSTAAGLGPTGPANDGEVEDYRLTLEPVTPTVSFTVTGQDVAEAGGSVTATIQLSHAIGADVTVPLTLGGTATPGATDDFTVSPSSVTIPAGSTTAQIVITINNDTLAEPAETALVTLGTPVNAQLGSIPAHTATILDDDTPVLTVDVAAASVAEHSGAGATTVTITRNLPLADDLLVTLSSSDPGEATVQATATIPAGQAAVTVPLDAVDDALLDGAQPVTISASAAGFVSGWKSLSVTDYETVSISFSTTTVAENGGTVTATVTRSNTNISSALTVTLSSSDTSEATVPTSVSIPVNQASATFTVTIINDSILDGPQTVTISATATNYAAGVANLQVLDHEPLSVSVSVSPISEKNGTATGTVTRVNSDRSLPLTVELASSDTSEALVPATVTIAANATSATFTVTAVDDNLLDGTQTVTIAASATGYASATTNFGVKDYETATISFSSSSISENGGTTTGTLTRTNTDIDAALTVTMFTSDTSEATVPSSVTIPANESSATFTITAVDDTLLDGAPTVTVYAMATGYETGSQVVSITDYETLSVEILPNWIPENGGTAVGKVTRSNTDISSAVSVSLSSSDLTAATVSATVSIPANQTYATFVITLVDDGLADGTQAVTLLAAATGYVDGAGTLNVTDDEGSHLAVTVSPAAFSENGGTATGTVTRNNADLDSELAVTLASSDTSEATVLDTVTIPAGQASATFSIAAVDDQLRDGAQSVAVTASAAGIPSGGAVVSVTDYEPLTVSITPGSFSENGGSATGTVSRSNTDRSAALTVSLSSSDTTEATVPSSVTIAANQASVTFTINRVDDWLLDGTQTVTITASASGYENGTASVNVTDYETLTLTISPTWIIAENGGTTNGTVKRNNSDIGLPVTVNLASSDTTEAVVPATVTIPGGLMSASFTITGVDDALRDGTQSVTITASGLGYANATQPVNVNDSENLTVTIASDSMSEDGGLIIGTVTRSDTDTSAALTVNLSRSDATEATVPTPITIPADQTSVDFSIAAVDDTLLDGTQSVTITASASGFNSGTGTLSVTDFETLSVTIAPPAISENGGGALGTITRSNTNISSALTVTLSSSDTTGATVPASVTIPANQASATFLVDAVNDALFDGVQTVIVTAVAAGYLDGSGAVDVTDDEQPILLLSVSPSTFSENGGTATGTVTRTNANLSADLVVALSSSDSPTNAETTEAAVPATVTIPAGQASVAFPVMALDDTLLDGTQMLFVLASAPGFSGASSQISVTDYETVSLSITPNSISENGGTATGTVTRSNTDNSAALTVSLSSSDITEATVPATVTIAANQTSATFPISAVDDLLRDGTQIVTISATAAGYVNGSAVVDVTDYETLVVRLSPDSISEYGGTATGTVMRTNTNLDIPLTVSLTSSDATEATVPATVTILANQNSATFLVTAVDDTLLDGTQTVTITASDGGYVSGSQSLKVTDYEPLSLSISPTSISENSGTAIGTVTRSNTGDGTPLTVALVSSDTTEATVPATVTIPAGQPSATFVIAAVDDTLLDGTQTVTITASSDAGGQHLTAAGSLEVTDFVSLAVSVSLASISENGGAATGTVTRNNTDVSAPLTVLLTSSDTTEATVPASVTIPAGQASATFAITAADDALLDGTLPVTITATMADWSPAMHDSGFGTAGVAATTHRGNYIPAYRDIEIQPDGKIVTAGQHPTDGQAWQVTRFNADGSLDTGFGTTGTVSTHFPTNFVWEDVRPRSIALHADGRIVVVGTGVSGWLIARYNPDGTHDASFGMQGRVELRDTVNSDSVEVAANDNGSLFIAGEGWTSSGIEWGKIAADGTFLGSTFVNQPGTVREWPYALTHYPDGRMVVVGWGQQSSPSEDESIPVVRFLVDGSRDETFGPGGLQSVAFGAVETRGTAVKLQPDGKIVIAGAIQQTTSSRMNWVLSRLNPDGSLDSSFNGDGKAVLDLGGTGYIPTDLVIQDDGYIVVVGSQDGNGAMVRYRPDGDLDFSFGTAGVQIFPASQQGGTFEAAAIQPDGKLVTYTLRSVNESVVERFLLPPAVALREPASATFSVTDYETLAVTPSPTSISESGGTITATVTRSNTNLSSPLTVDLASSDASEAIVPATVTILANQASATFAVTAVDDVLLDGTQTVTVMASAGGYVAGTAQVQVTDLENPPTVTSPIQDLTVAEDAANTVIDLEPVFTDPDLGLGDALTYTATVAMPIDSLVAQVSQTSYATLHQDLLYTHTGDNRGLTGPDHDLARDNIYSYFAGLGLQASLEPVVYNSQTYYNVVGVQRGVTRPNDVYLVGAHYDSVNNPGADDNASGTAAVMELARVLTQYAFDATLVFVGFDREEQGLVGASAYTASHNMSQVKGMLSLDMIAYNPAGTDYDKVRLYDWNGSGTIKSALASAFASYGGGLTTVNSGTTYGSDHYPFEVAGVDAALVIEYNVWTNSYYHRATDAVETAGNIDYVYATKITRGAMGYLATAAGLRSESELLTVTVSGQDLILDYAPDAHGIADIRVRATDTQNLFAEDTFRVTVTPVNDAPVLDNAGAMTLAAIDEDAVTNPGTLVRDIVAGAGGDRIIDADFGSLEGLAVTAVDNAHGTWQYTINNGRTWLAFGTPTAANSRLLGSDAGTRVRFVPVANWNGTVDPGLTFRAWDHTTGGNGGTADATTGGGETAFSAATEITAITVTNVLETFIISDLVPSTTGFVAQLQGDIESSVLNLYDQGGILGPADVTVMGASLGQVRGSLVVHPGLRQLTFIKTAGLLEPDTYTVTLKSGATALRDTAGRLLDGDADEVDGGDYVTTFVVSPSPANAVTVSLPNVTRGYGQPVNLPANNPTAGLPLTLSSGLNVSRVTLQLRYDPTLLNISDFTLDSAVAGRGGQATITFPSPGIAALSITAPAGLAAAAGTLAIGSFTARVPDDAPYGGKHILDIAGLHVYDTATPSAELPSIADDAIHVAAFLGDTNGDGRYNSPDATLTRRIIGQVNSGFSAFPLADPVLLADITLDNGIQSNDTTGIRRAIGQVAVPNIPALPTGLTFPAASGADPRVYIPRDLAGSPGATVTVPVMIDVTEPAGITIGGFDLVMEFDPGRFTVSQAKLGALLQGTDLAGTMTQPVPGKLIFSADSLVGTSRFSLGTVGTLLTLTVTIAPDAAPGPATWNLLASMGTSRTGVFGGDLQELVLNPAPTNGALDSGDGVLLVDDGLSPWHNTADGLDVNADGLVSALDALIVINRLNAEAAGGGSAPAAFYYDVNDDSVCTAQDVLVVINHLNAGPLPLAEGEPTTPWSPTPTAAGTSTETNLKDRVFHDMERDLSSLEGVLGDLAADVASA